MTIYGYTWHTIHDHIWVHLAYYTCEATKCNINTTQSGETVWEEEEEEEEEGREGGVGNVMSEWSSTLHYDHIRKITFV